jgi:hypothetical protein
MTENSNQQRYAFNTMPSSNNNITDIHIAKERKLVPIIFLPGVMGSNLKDKETNEKVWRLDSEFSALPWLLWKIGDAEARKEKLDPQKTEVDDRGEVVDAASNQVLWVKTCGMAEDSDLSYESLQQQIDQAIKNHPENKWFGTRRERGWGSVSYISYGNFLENFQLFLFQTSGQISSKLKSLTKQPSFTLAAGSKTELTFTDDQLNICENYDLPIHVMGYNWLASITDSAARLKTLVEQTIPAFYKKKGRTVDKVIVVTHSMGGLVARYYTEALDGQDKVYGVINGVQPSTGAVAAYTRMKRGNEASWPMAEVLGKDAAEMTAVLGQSPGPLQLLPSVDYGMGWLTITNPAGQSQTYPKSDPYKEIYLNKDDWWCVCEPHLINPRNSKKKLAKMQKDWEKYEDLINRDVKTFHEKIAHKYHPNTYVFYGLDDNEQQIKKEFLTYDVAHWQGQYIKGYKSQAKSAASDHIGDQNRLDLSEILESRTLATNNNNGEEVKETIDYDTKQAANYTYSIGNIVERYTLKPATANGDSTVPKCSGEIPIESIKARMHIPVDHEGAYKEAIAQEFTLRAIVDILLEVNKQDETQTTAD